MLLHSDGPSCLIHHKKFTKKKANAVHSLSTRHLRSVSRTNPLYQPSLCPQLSSSFLALIQSPIFPKFDYFMFQLPWFAQRASSYWTQKPNCMCAVTSSSSFTKLFIILPLCLFFMPVGHTDISFLLYLNISCLLWALLFWHQPCLWRLQKNSIGYARSVEAGLNATKRSMTSLLISAGSGLKFTFRNIMITY